MDKILIIDLSEAPTKEKIMEWVNAAYDIGYEDGRRSVTTITPTWWEPTTPRFSPGIEITCSGTE